MIIIFFSKYFFALFIIVPLLLLVGMWSFIEEYFFLRHKWVIEYILKVSNVWNHQPISRDKVVEIKVERMNGGIANVVRKVSIQLSDSDKPKQVVFKKYRLLGSIYSFIGFFLGPFPFSRILPRDRQQSEQIAVEHFTNIGISAPKVLFLDTRQKITVFQFIEGERLDKAIFGCRQTGRINDMLFIFYNYGLNVAAIHHSGWSLIDANPFNIIFMNFESRISFVDLELSSFSNNQDWDLAYLLNAIEKIAEGDLVHDIKKHFLDGYSFFGGRSMNENVKRHKTVLQQFNRLHQLSQNTVVNKS